MSASACFASGRTCVPALTVAMLACAFEAGAQQPLAASRQADVVSDARSAGNRASPLEDYRRLYDEALERGQFLEAETAAKQLIDRMIATGEQGYRPMADALTSLAFAQRKRELYEPALANYRAAIELLASGENRLSSSLIAPLAALGDTYMASGRANLALPVYQRALHVRHVNDGPHTLEQIDLLDATAAAFAATGDANAALGAFDHMYYLYARKFSPGSEEVIPALERKAGLLNELGRHQEERMVYRDIVKIVEDRRGEHALRLFDTYLALGHTYFYDLDEVHFRSEPTTETGETFLELALEIAETNPRATWQMEARVLLELGDYYTLRDVQDKARIHYRRAWDLLSADERRLDERKDELEGVRALIEARLDPFANFGYGNRDGDADDTDYKQGYVVAHFTINDRGRVNDVEISDAEPEGFAEMETHVLQAVRDLLYRPRYEDGDPVPTSGQRYRHDYRYLESELQAARRSGH